MESQGLHDGIQKVTNITPIRMVLSGHTSVASAAAPSSAPPRHSARHASSRAIKTVDTTSLKQYAGADWKTDAEIQVWILSDSVKPYLEEWKRQYLDDPDHLRNLHSFLGDDSSDWVRHISLISRYRHHEHNADPATDTRERPPEKVLCRAAALIVDNDIDGILRKARSDIEWPFGASICLLLTVLHDLADNPEGFTSSEVLGPLQAGWGSGSTQDGKAV